MGLISDRSKSAWKEKFLPWEILTFEMVFSLNLREKKVIFKKMKIETERVNHNQQTQFLF